MNEDKNQTRKALVSALANTRPDIHIATTWEQDPYYEWDGDGPDPQEKGLFPHDVTVTASTIKGGLSFTGKATLGGSYSEFEGPHCTEVGGYFPQMMGEALGDLETKTCLYAVVPISKEKGELAPRFDLAPMNHAAACNFMDACRNSHTDYRLEYWPEEVAHPKPPQYRDAYRRDQKRG